MCQTSIHHCLLLQTKSIMSQNIYLIQNIHIICLMQQFMTTRNHVTVFIYTIQYNAYCYLKNQIRQWTIPHHSTQIVTAGLVINVASSYIFLLVGRSMTMKNMGTGSFNIIHSNCHMTSVNQPMMNV
jgi:hypothetical protein